MLCCKLNNTSFDVQIIKAFTLLMECTDESNPHKIHDNLLVCLREGVFSFEKIDVLIVQKGCKMPLIICTFSGNKVIFCVSAHTQSNNYNQTISSH